MCFRQGLSIKHIRIASHISMDQISVTYTLGRNILDAEGVREKIESELSDEGDGRREM